MMKNIQYSWTQKELDLLNKLTEPYKIQKYLDSIGYDPKPENRSPRWVIKEKLANCFEGAIFAVACLRHINFEPMVIDLRAVNDDDHEIAVYRIGRCWGAVAKSNFTTLQFREPVYRTLRELAMSYFDLYFNTKGEKTLREYSVPLNLSKFDERNWMTTDEDLEYIGECLDRIRHFRLIDKKMERSLSGVSKKLLDAGLIGSDSNGLYKPK